MGDEVHKAAHRLAQTPLAQGFQPEALHVYTDKAGEPLFWRIRLKHPETGEKWIRPMHLGPNGFELREPDFPRGKPLYRLHELATKPSDPVWLVEGEKCVDALTNLGVLATTTGGASSDDTADLEPLRGRTVTIWPDNDGPGIGFAERLALRLKELGCVVEVVDPTLLGLPKGGDAVDWLRANPEAKAADLARLPRRPFPPVLEEHPGPTWGKRQALPHELPEASSLPPEMLPRALRGWLVDLAEQACLPLEMLAVPALVGLSGLVGRSVAVRPRAFSNWTVTPNLWGAVVAPPGAKKSDAIADALRPLRSLEAKARKAHEAQSRKIESERMELEGRLGQLKKKAASKEELQEVLSRIRELQNVVQRRYITNDATAEKLGELLKNNPRGLTVVRDELASWLAAMELQESAVARGFFLSAWNGATDYTFDRIGRGTVHVEAACLSMIGAVQPEPLKAAFDRLRSDPTRADGMLQRFQLIVWPDAMPPWNPPQRWPDRVAEQRAGEVFERLDGLEVVAPDGELKPRLLTLDDDAREAFAEWHDAHENRLRAGELAETPHFASHIAKYAKLVASLAVLFHLVDLAEDEVTWSRATKGDDLPPVSLNSVNLALDWSEFLELHARKVYAAELAGETLAAHRLAQAIQKGTVRDGMSVRDLLRNDKRWRREQLGEALGVLEQLGWLKVVEVAPGPLGGRPSEIIRLHPELQGGENEGL